MEEKTKEKFLLHDTIISWACIIWAVASIGFMIYFSGIEQVTFTLMTFGQLFFILGVVSICRRQITGFVFMVTGIGCIIILAINEWGYLFNMNSGSDNIFPIMLSTAITILGLAMIIIPDVLEDIYKRRCKKNVTAEIIEFKITNLNDGTTVYAPIYKYEINGKEYNKCTEKYKRNKEKEIGSKVDIKINENKPEEIYIETSKASKMIIYTFGASFFIAGLGMILTVLAEI